MVIKAKKIGKTKAIKKTTPAKKLKTATAKPKKAMPTKAKKKTAKTPVKKATAMSKKTKITSQAKKKTPVSKALSPKKVVKLATKSKVSAVARKTPLESKKPSKPVKSAPKLKVIKNDFMPGSARMGEAGLPSYLVGLDIAPYQEKPGEEYMNEKQRQHFRNILSKWKAQLLQEMNRTVHHLQDEAINLPDPNDRASQEEEFSLELRARDRERKLIKKIEETFQKIEEGEYGYCDSCGVEIGIRRLEARPTANLCIDCKTLDEIRERQMGG